MDKRFLIKMAFKNILTHKLRSFLTFLGISIGVTAIVFLVGFGFGLERLVTDQVTGGDAFKLVDVGTGNSQVVSLNQKAVDQINKLSNTKDIEVIINAGANARKDANSTMDVSFYGTSATYLDWLGLKMQYGQSIPNNADANDVVVSTAYLKFMGIDPESAVGKKVKFAVTIPQEITESSKINVAEQEFAIVGVILDDSVSNIYANYQLLNKMGAKRYSQAKVEIKNQNQVEALRIQIENLGFKTQYVGDTVNQIGEVFNIFKVILAAFGLIALVVAALGMFNTLTISLLERTKEIALMKILGMRRKDINGIFLSEAVMFGIFGGTFGILFGILFGFVSNKILNHFAIAAGGNATAVFYYPFWFILVIVFFSLLIGFLCGLYPARRATKLDALDVLRYE